MREACALCSNCLCSRPNRLSLFTKTLIIAFRCNEESDGGDCSHICMHCHDKEKCHYQCVPGPGNMLWAYQGTVGGEPAPGCCESVALTTMACASNALLLSHAKGGRRSKVRRLHKPSFYISWRTKWRGTKRHRFWLVIEEGEWRCEDFVLTTAIRPCPRTLSPDPLQIPSLVSRCCLGLEHPQTPLRHVTVAHVPGGVDVTSRQTTWIY